MKKKRKKKQSAKISQHEDAALKVTAQFFRDEIMPDKFLDSKEMEQLKEEIKMTRLGKMLYEDGTQNGAQTKLKEQVKKKIQKGCSVAEIADMLEEEVGVIEKIIKEL